MELSTEYLVIIDKKSSDTFFRMCDSDNSFNKFLQTENDIEISEGKLTYQNEHSFIYHVTNGIVEDKEQRYFHLELRVSKDSTDLGKFVEVNKLIKTLVHNAGAQPETLWNDISLFYSRNSYPYIHHIENLMRKLITYFMLTTVGKEWVSETSPGPVKEAIDKSKSKQYLDVLYQIDFIHLGDFLFKQYETKNVSELHSKLEEVTSLDEVSLEELKSYIPKSNWDRYFSNIVECEGAYLDKKWKRLYEFRCKIAHNTLIGVNDYEIVKELVEEVSGHLEQAFQNIDLIHLSEADREHIAENVVSNINSLFVIFIEKWKVFESLLKRISKDLSFTEKPETNRHIWSSLFDIEVISKPLFIKGMSLFKFRDVLVHDISVSISEVEIETRLHDLEYIANELKLLLKPSSFNEDCMAKIRDFLNINFLRITGTTYHSEDSKTGVVCVVSRSYDSRKNERYWFGIHPSQVEFLKNFKVGYYAFGCGSNKNVLILKSDVFEKYLDHMHTTESKDRLYWHVKIGQIDRNFQLNLTHRDAVDLSEYLIEDN